MGKFPVPMNSPIKIWQPNSIQSIIKECLSAATSEAAAVGEANHEVVEVMIEVGEVAAIRIMLVKTKKSRKRKIS